MEKQRERLKELIKNVPRNTKMFYDQYADYLIRNGVVVLPCKVGDTVYFLNKMDNRITAHVVDNIYIGKKEISIRLSGLICIAKPHKFGRIFFTSRKEAEAALKGGVL